MPLFVCVQCVSWSILLLVSVLTISGWLAAIFHDKSVIFCAQGTQWIDTILADTQDEHFLVALSYTL